MNRTFFRHSRTTWILSVFSVIAVIVAASATAVAARGIQHQAIKHKAPITVSVQLNWLTNVEFSGLWIADHFGWLAKAGFKLKATGWSPGISPEDTTAACWQGSSSDKNKLCIGFDDSSAIPIARAAGNNLVGIWTGSQRTPFGFMTCKVPKHGVNKKCKSNTGKNITSPKQWKGLKIGYQSHELYVAELMLASAGLSLSNVTPVTVGFDQTELYKGSVDAYLVFVNNEPLTAKLDGVPVNIIPAYKYGMGSFYADTMFAPQAEVATRGAQLKAFVTQVDRGWKWAMAHSKQAADIVVANYFKGNPVKQQELEEHAFAASLSRDNANKVDGQMTLARWQDIVTKLRHSKGDIGGGPVLSKNVPAKDCFTNKFAPKAGGTI